MYDLGAGQASLLLTHPQGVDMYTGTCALTFALASLIVAGWLALSLFSILVSRSGTDGKAARWHSKVHVRCTKAHELKTSGLMIAAIAGAFASETSALLDFLAHCNTNSVRHRV